MEAQPRDPAAAILRNPQTTTYPFADFFRTGGLVRPTRSMAEARSFALLFVVIRNVSFSESISDKKTSDCLYSKGIIPAGN
jgi:hypothetical protein